jgi:hypothetical protein
VLSTQFRTAFAEFMPLVQMLVTILPVVIIGVAILDIVQGFRRAYRAMNPALPS